MFYGQSIFLIEQYALVIAQSLGNSDEIEKLYFDNKDNVGLKNDFIEIYTGYNFDNNTSICNKLDNEKIKYPIYLRIAYDEKNQTYAAVWSR